KFPFADRCLPLKQCVSERNARKRKCSPGEKAEVPRMIIPIEIRKNETRQSLETVDQRREENETGSCSTHRNDVCPSTLKRYGKQPHHKRRNRNAIQRVYLEHAVPLRCGIPN